MSESATFSWFEKKISLFVIKKKLHVCQLNTRIIVIDEREELKISLLMQNLFLPREIHRNKNKCFVNL